MTVLLVVRTFFEVLFSLALTALPVMAAVIAVRWVLEKCRAPKRIAYALWAVVGFRLCCPVTLSSAASLFYAVRPVAQATARVRMTGTGAANFSTVNYGSTLPTFKEIAPMTGVGADNILSVSRIAPAELALRIAAVAWLAGLAAIVIYSVVSYLRLRRRMAAAVLLEDRVYAIEGIATPFVLGFLRPKIYVPSTMEESERAHVLLHERTHLRRGDPWWKLLGFGVLAVYWWNPAAWLCWALFCRDMEMSCDEAVLRALGPEVKRAYSLSLVGFASARRFPAANPLAFGESDAKSRVKNVLNWKQTRAGIGFLAVTLAVAVAVACCTNAQNRSWVKLEQPQNGPGVAFTCNLLEPIQSWAIYEDVYENGQLISSVPRISDGFSEDGTGATSRKFSGELTYQTVSNADSGFAGTLNCTAMGMNWGIALPKDHYTGCGSAVGGENGGTNPFKTSSMGENGEQLLLSVVFSTAADGGVTLYDKGQGTAGTNDTVVQFHLVTSTSAADQFASSSYADTLFVLKTSYVGNMPADGKILEALGVQDELGTYTVELFTSKEPYILQVNFTDEPADTDPTSPSVDRAMRGNAAILLALIDNLGQVNWTYPAGADGMKVTHLVTFTQADADALAQSAGYTDIKTLGETVEGIQALLDNAASQSESEAAAADGAVSETAFTDILGYDGVIRETAGANGFVTRDYVAEIDGAEHVIAESFGWEPQDCAADLDGDGVKELVCNVTYGADGVRVAYVYRRQGKWTACGSLTTDDLPSDFSNWGANAAWSEYDPAANVFRLHYYVEGQDDYAVRESTGYDHMEFYNVHE